MNPCGLYVSIVKANGLTLHHRQPSFAEPSPQDRLTATRGSVRRRITPEAGRGLEKLGHALEYLTDEFVHDGCNFRQDRGRLEAIQLLASLNRQIYLACAVEPSFLDRVQGLAQRWFPAAGSERLVSIPGKGSRLRTVR
jgi:hypothetical protein